MIITKIIFTKLFAWHVTNIGTKHYKLLVCHQIGELVQVVFCSAASVIASTFVEFHSGSGKGNRSWLQWPGMSIYFHPQYIYVATKTLLSQPVIDSVINLVLDTVPRLLANLVWSDPIFTYRYYHVQYKHLMQAAHTESYNGFCAKLRADHTRLAPSCHVSTLIKALHFFNDTSSDTWLYDHIVTIASYMFVWTDMESWNLFLRNLLSQKNQTLREFYTTKIWSNTITTLYSVNWLFF